MDRQNTRLIMRHFNQMVRDNPCVLLVEDTSVINQVIRCLQSDVRYLRELQKNLKGSFVWQSDDCIGIGDQ